MSPEKLTEKQLADILREANLVSAADLDRARQKQERTGYTLREILLPQVPWGRMRMMLENDVTLPDGTRTRLGDVLADAGWVTRGQLEDTRREEEERGGAVARILVEQGIVNTQQLQEAVAYHQRTGVPLWRALVNLDLVLPKQVSEAFQLYKEFPALYRSDEELTKVLLDGNLLSREQMQKLLDEHEKLGVSLVRHINESGAVRPTQFAQLLSTLFNMPFVDLASQKLTDDALGALPPELILKLQVLPFAREGKKVKVALADPTAMPGLMRMAALADVEFEPYVAAADALRRGIEDHVMPRAKEAPDERQALLMALQAEAMKELSGDASIGLLTESILTGAFRARATDIHLESQERGLRVRYRIDGLLHDVMNIPPSTGLGVISRLKVMSNLDIVERRRPQDGHLTFETQGRTLDMRISTVPGYLGEGVVIRIINEETVVQGLGQLGLEPQQRSLIDTLLAKPYGMILAAGPVGSGKTTTIYACVNQVNVLEDNVLTIEDPVEYRLKGTNQLQVDYRRGFDFVTGLRAILRQDPDIIMVGEIRDEETAKIAVRAALTGVLVLSTLHGNDAASTVSSLYQYNIPGFLISNAVIGVIAQRLVRKVCPSCRKEYIPGSEVYQQVGVAGDERGKVPFYRGLGCPRCFHTGYSGRTGVFEVMEVTEPMKELIFRETTREAILRLAVEQGMQTLKETGRRKVMRGETTVEEFFRVIFV